MTETTIRMRRCGGESTLDGYVFADHAHAHQWLSQSYVDRAKIQLEEVEVGPITRCRRCGGAGSYQSVKIIRKLTPDEVQNV